MDEFDPFDGYWYVRDKEEWWHSGTSQYISTAPDAQVITIASEAELVVVLKNLGLPYPTLPLTADDVWVEYNRRVAAGFNTDLLGGFPVNTSSSEAFLNISGLVTRAILMLQEVVPTADSAVTDASGKRYLLTPQQIITLGFQMAQFKEQLYEKAVTVATMTPIPDDYKDNKYWP